MGIIWSTQEKKFIDNNVTAVCNDDEYSDESLIYNHPSFANIYTLIAWLYDYHPYVSLTSSAYTFKVPRNITKGQYCELTNMYAFISFINFNETYVFMLGILCLLIGLYSFRKNNIISGILIIVALILFWRSMEPSGNITYNQLYQPLPHNRSLTARSTTNELRSYAQTVLQKVLNNQIPINSTTKSQQGSNFTSLLISEENGIHVELINILPNTQLDLHKHETNVVGIALSNLEVSFDGITWTLWSNRTLLDVPSGLSHTIRTGANGGSLLSIHNAPNGITNDYIV